MTLGEYLQTHSLSQAQFAKQIGAVQSDVARYLNGRKPREEVMRKIFDVTGGDVRADDFYGLPAADAEQAPKVA